MRALGMAIFVLAILCRVGVGGQTMSASVDWVSQSGTTGGPSDLSVGNFSRRQEKFEYVASGLASHFTISGALAVAQADYSRVLLRARDGEVVPLSDLFPKGDELTGEIGLEFADGSHYAGLGWKGDLSAAPYSRQSLRAAYRKGFFNQSTILGMRAVYLQQSQPVDFFIDRNFKNQPRPMRIHGNEVAVSLEQILTARWKTLLEVSTSRREQERPRNVAVSWYHAYALTNRLYTQLELSQITEGSGSELKDERGYFSLRSAEISITVEPIYDLLVSVSYGIVLEKEADPRVDSETQMGSDQYGLGITYTRGEWKFSLRPGYRISNTRAQSFTVTGGLSWQI